MWVQRGKSHKLGFALTLHIGRLKLLFLRRLQFSVALHLFLDYLLSLSSPSFFLSLVDSEAMWTCCVTSIHEQAFHYCEHVCLWVKALSISFEVRFFLKSPPWKVHTLLGSVCCVSSICVLFFISMWKLCSLLSERGPLRLKSLSALSFSLVFFSSTLPFFFPFSPPSPVYKAFAHKLQRITRHTPFRSTEPYSTSVTSQRACVCVNANIWAFEISHFLPARRKESGGGKTKRVGWKGEADWVIAAHQHRGRNSQRAELWPAASQCHHTAFVRRVDLERTFQRGREKSGRWQKNTENGGNERTSEQEEKGAKEEEK